ncbi:hypothetical protein J6590_033441 [Homalodisca vitripennis]|nr:hypothetical protein J6590_033441 [Homalodisca vitripennis]
MEMEQSVEEREDTLQHLLNTDPTLDLHLMEAVKLHMMVAALNLHDSYSKGQDVPLFSILLFARDTSEVPLDFMNNHLVKVGNTGGLEQNLSRFVNASKVWRATASPGATSKGWNPPTLIALTLRDIKTLRLYITYPAGAVIKCSFIQCMLQRCLVFRLVDSFI